MNAPTERPTPKDLDAKGGALASRLRSEIQGDVLFDPFSRGRYSTDASIYQIMPIGVVVPRTREDALRAMQIAVDARIPLLPRGGGTSQCGQTVGEALVIDNSKHLNNVLAFDKDARKITVEPGMVLDQLNKFLKPHNLFFPVDPSTASRATIGGMAGNNSCGTRSLRYGNMVHNVHAIKAVLSTGEEIEFGPVRGDLNKVGGPPKYRELVTKMHDLYAHEKAEIEARFPKLLRRVAGYNIDMMSATGFNMAHLLVGSEGTLAYFTALELDLQPVLVHKVVGVCHFPKFYAAMASSQHIVKLGPSAVELVDRTMIELAREIPVLRASVEKFVRGEPDAILLVEFAGDDQAEQVAKLKQLVELMADLGFPGSVVEILDPNLQHETAEVRKAGLNIMMSMKGDGKPVSFIEDCAVSLEDLADYTDRLTQVFEKHGTKGTWYAHASVGCLHVRPVLNMKDESGAKKMRAIAEEAAELIREYKGSYSGEHGDGLVRSEWIEPMFGARLVRAFEAVKDAFDPLGLMNPGKIVRAPKMDDRSLFRYKPGYQVMKIDSVLDWSEKGGFGATVEMCNNNGECRKRDAGVMCPSFRATHDEQHLTRGRANTLRLAISGQLGPDAFTSDEMYDTLALCVSCKGCKRECPTGVDMAKMKIEFLHHYHKRHGLRMKDRLVADLPHYATTAARMPWLFNLRDAIPGLAKATEGWLGLTAKRRTPKWRGDPFFSTVQPRSTKVTGDEVVLFVDTFNNYFEPENAHAALRVLEAAGYRVHVAKPRDGGRPLCCGRTYLAVGSIEQARAEANRVLDHLLPYAERGVPIVGLEPSCALTFRDEFLAMGLGDGTSTLAKQTMLLEEFLAREKGAERLKLTLKPLPEKRALLHGHCHQKAFNAVKPIQTVLSLIPDFKADLIDTSCCGMAGSFGYDTRYYDVSMQMAEMNLLPAVRKAAADTLLIADGTSCRHQIADGTGRKAVHVARVLERALG